MVATLDRATRQKVTSKEDIQQALNDLDRHRSDWAKMEIPRLLHYIARAKQDLAATMEEWVDAAVAAKGGEGDSAAIAQEWLGGPFSVLRNLSLLHRSMSDIAKTGKPKLPGKTVRNRKGRLAVDVFPTDNIDRMLFMGSSAQIWLQEGVTEQNLADHQAEAYTTPKEKAEISLVLCAGNVSSIGPMDCIYKLFNERKVVILKMHPVNAYLGPFFERMFEALIQDGYLRIVYGDAEEGSFLCNHEMVGDIHITGSDKTHDIIVFGRDVAANKAARKPVLTKPITSELGNVSPVIVVPGRWSDADLKYQARSIASSLVNNAGFNCNASRVVITHKGWPQRHTLIQLVEDYLHKIPTRRAYYPGAQQRYASFKEQHPEAREIGQPGEGQLPWMFVRDLNPDKKDDICFNTEAFCGVFGEVGLEAEDQPGYLKAATDFANNTMWGTLNVTLIAHPKSIAAPAHRDAFEQAVADLRYGTVSVNQWAAVGYAIGSTTWGAYPEHDIYDIKSGLDVVHNTYMFSKVEKSVLRFPFRQFPLPAYFVNVPGSDKVGKKMSEYESTRSLLKLPGVFAAALGL